MQQELFGIQPNLNHRKSKYSQLKKNLLNEFQNYEYIEYKEELFTKRFNFVDLFAGGGRMSLGIKNAGLFILINALGLEYKIVNNVDQIL